MLCGPKAKRDKDEGVAEEKKKKNKGQVSQSVSQSVSFVGRTHFYLDFDLLILAEMMMMMKK